LSIPIDKLDLLTIFREIKFNLSIIILIDCNECNLKATAVTELGLGITKL